MASDVTGDCFSSGTVYPCAVLPVHHPAQVEDEIGQRAVSDVVACQSRPPGSSTGATGQTLSAE